MGCSSSSNALVSLPNENGQQERKIVFTKTGKAGLGVGAKPNSQGEAVVFMVVDGGMINLWNHRNPHCMVTKGDRVVSVNGVTSFWPMMFELQNKGTHEIVVRSGSLDDFVSMDASSGPKKERTVSEDVLNSLPLASAADCVGMECSICLEELNELEANVRLPCNHCFHKTCAENWLTKRRGSCPLCQLPVTAESVMSCQRCTEVSL